MKKFTTLLISGFFMFLLYGCGGQGSDGNSQDETRMDVEEFLSYLDIPLFEGSEIITKESGQLVTFVPADIAGPTEIMEYYTPKVEEALTGRDPWVRQIKAPGAIHYRRGYTGWNFGIDVNPMEMDGGYEVNIIYRRL